MLDDHAGQLQSGSIVAPWTARERGLRNDTWKVASNFMMEQTEESAIELEEKNVTSVVKHHYVVRRG